MAFLDGSAESGMVFKGDLCLAEKKREYYGEKEGLFASALFFISKKRVGPCGTRGKNWWPVHAKSRNQEKAYRRQAYASSRFERMDYDDV